MRCTVTTCDLGIRKITHSCLFRRLYGIFCAEQCSVDVICCRLTMPATCCLTACCGSLHRCAVKGQAGREGTVVKTLKWSRAPDGRAYFINASVSDKANGINNSVSVSLTNAEFYTFKRLADYSIPYMLGWDTMFNTPT
eukprot:GHRQ01017778.1.p1 GENE.GHRQ01017778.1~~GHRQ01017778.1.p1  ORF type:complete len:139 (-),score=24.43 GHRQ01017778.1:1034-1450(-)